MATLGESRVRTEFNPSKDGTVDQIKQRSASLIDYINEMELPKDSPKYGEFKRLQALALTHIEDAAMWAVKAATI